MEWLSKPRSWVILGVLALGLLLLQQMWVWEVERVEVPPNSFLVKINLWGKDLPDGEIVAPDDSYKGVQRRVLTEGRHFLNPIFYSYEKQKVLEVPEGKCAILTRKAGKALASPEEYLAPEPFDEFAQEALGSRGILATALQPGKYYINPYEYTHELVDAIKVEANQVGVKVLRYGKDPRELTSLLGRAHKEIDQLKRLQRQKDGAAVGEKELAAAVDKWLATNAKDPKLAVWLRDRIIHNESVYVVPEGYRGVQEKPVPPAWYPINPYLEQIVPVDIRSHPVEFTDIVFPSRDGFMIQPHVLVAYKVLPEKAPELFVLLTDEGKLHQKDDTPEDQQKNPILQKFVLPLIRGHVRIEGSKYDARDYISQQPAGKAADDKPAADAGTTVNPRERLQAELMKKVAPACEKVGVLIEEITVAQLEMNKELSKLADQISERERTRITREKNKKLVAQHKAEQQQKAKEALADQRKLVVEASTKLEREKINAERLKEVEGLRLEAELKSAEARLEGAKKRAEATVTEGKAEAAVITAKNEAEVASLKTAVGGFPSPEQFAQYHVLMRMAPALAEIFASDTSEFAKVFSGYLLPGGKKPTTTAATPPPAPPAATADAKKPTR
ncbi:MAG: SPFH domain-containing protein [Gemmataceae bacterium]